MDDFQKERMLKDPKERAKLQEEIEAKQASQNATNDAIQEIANRA